MPGRHDTLVEHDVDFRDDEWEPDDELPPRPRRRALTPAGIALLAILLGAGAFIAGVEVQKGRQPAATTAGGGGLAAAARAGGFGAGAGARAGGGGGFGAFGGAGGGAAPTFGTVANKHGGTLYVRSSSGTTLRVTTSHAKITRTASTSARGVYPGDTVIVQGTTNANGSISATQIRATARGAGGAGGGPGG